ncbi:MAG: hypothetical protein ACLUYK_11335, partial [Eggerthella lenta]
HEQGGKPAEDAQLRRFLQIGGSVEVKALIKRLIRAFFIAPSDACVQDLYKRRLCVRRTCIER